jgi:Rhodanese-like domain
MQVSQVIVLDVRPEAEYAAEHIPGAINVPHDQLAARLADLPAELLARADIVAYCRGRYCVYAPDVYQRPSVLSRTRWIHASGRSAIKLLDERGVIPGEAPEVCPAKGRTADPPPVPPSTTLKSGPGPELSRRSCTGCRCSHQCGSSRTPGDSHRRSVVDGPR